MSTDLRSGLIRLAYANPDLRADILPLIAKHAGDDEGMDDMGDMGMDAELEAEADPTSHDQNLPEHYYFGKTSASGGGTAEKHQLKVLTDTVKNPMKGKFLGGPSAEEAEETLRKKFHFTDKQIESLKKANFNGTGKTAASGEWSAVFASLDGDFKTYNAKAVTDWNKVYKDMKKKGVKDAGAAAHFYHEYRAGRMDIGEAAAALAKEGVKPPTAGGGAEKQASTGKTAGTETYEEYVRDWKKLRYPVAVKGEMLPKEKWEQLMGKGKTAAERLEDIEKLLTQFASPASKGQNKPQSYYGLPPKGKQAAASKVAANYDPDDEGNSEVEAVRDDIVAALAKKFKGVKGSPSLNAFAVGDNRYSLHGERVEGRDNNLKERIQVPTRAKYVAAMVEAIVEAEKGGKQASVKTAAGSGAANAAFLRQSPLKNKILQAVAKHYNTSVSAMMGELTDPDAEAVYEYIGNDAGLQMQVYRDFKAKGF